MDLTSKELAVMKAAVQSRNKIKFVQPVLFLMFVAALLARLFGVLSGDEFASVAVPLLLLTMLLPQLAGSPRYNELIDILEERLPKKQTMVDVLAEELKKHPKV